MACLVLKNRTQVWVPVPQCQVIDGLRMCLHEKKVWSTTGLPEREMVRVDPKSVLWLY
jgi:hypothetical protein